MDIDHRKESHQRNDNVEHTLGLLRSIIAEPDRLHRKELDDCKHATIYILGCARSGTTFLLQYLTQKLDIAYPTNFLSRLYYAPYFGSLLQKLMVDLDFKKELLKPYSEVAEMVSFLGKTKGALSPNEFWYFWRDYFDIGEDNYIKNPSIVQIKEFVQALNTIKSVHDKAFVMKAMIANKTISKLAEFDKNAIIIKIERSVEYNAQSLLQSRQEFFGELSKWYSFKTENFNSLVCKDAYEQVVAQVIETNDEIERELSKVEESRIIRLKYEELKSTLPTCLNELSERLQVKIREEFNPPIINSNKIQLSNEEWDKIIRYKELYSKD
ncbi:sulfotransferase [Bacteroidota bacterium]